MAMTTDDMMEPVERFFEREYPAERSLFTNLEDGMQSDPYAMADIAYIAGTKESLHAVCMADSYEMSLTDVHGGIHASSSLDANYCWLALPLDEFRQGEELCNGLLESLCEERGVGLMTIQPSGLGWSAKEIVKPSRRVGRYLKRYDGLERTWRHNVTA